MRRIPWTLLLSALLCACGDGGVDGRPDRSTQILYAQEQVKLAMRDPDSAVFANVRVSHRNGRDFVCGEVNGANAFGGMAGRSRFVVGGDVAMEVEFTPEDFGHIWSALC